MCSDFQKHCVDLLFRSKGKKKMVHQLAYFLKNYHAVQLIVHNSLGSKFQKIQPEVAYQIRIYCFMYLMGPVWIWLQKWLN